MPYELERIQAWHRLVFELHIQGKKNTEIAEELNRSEQMISLIINSPQAQHEISLLREKRSRMLAEQGEMHVARARQVLEESSVQAAQYHQDLLGRLDVDPSIKQKSASYILDKCLGKEGENMKPSVHVTADVVDLLKKVLEESAKCRQEMREVENKKFVESTTITNAETEQSSALATSA